MNIGSHFKFPMFGSYSRQHQASQINGAVRNPLASKEDEIAFSSSTAKDDSLHFGSAVFLADFDRARHLDPDLDEFMNILDGKTDEKYLLDQISMDQYQVGEDGSIVVNKPKMKIPRFRHGIEEGGGNGDGDGDGDPGDDGNDPSDKAGKNKGNHKLEPWQHRFSPSEVAQAIADQAGLPFLKPDGGDSERVEVVREGMKPVPPGPLKRKPTYRNAIRRGVGQAVVRGEQPDFNKIYPQRADRRYEASEPLPIPHLKVAVIWMSDISGSNDQNMRNAARNASRFVSYPIKYQYGKISAELADDDYSDEKYFGKDGTGDGLRESYITYTTEADEVTEEEYYKRTQNGGTMISSGFDKAKEVIEKNYPPSEGWNVYVYNYSDGDNYTSDNQKAMDSIKELLDMGVRFVGHCDLETAWGGGFWGGGHRRDASDFKKLMDKTFKDNPHVGTTKISYSNKHKLEDFKPLIEKFLPANPEDPEWYEDLADAA